MGLDVYLYKYDAPVDEVIRQEREAEEAEERHWDSLLNRFGAGSYNELTPAQKISFDAKLAEWRSKQSKAGSQCRKIEQPSSTAPDHLFKIGYFRSSYNSGGFNHILSNRIGKDLYSIFGVKNGEYYQKVDWKKSLRRAKAALKQMEEYFKENGEFRVIEVSLNELSPSGAVSSEMEALKAFSAERKKWLKGHSAFECYSTGSGLFAKEPLKVVAVMQGTTPALFQKSGSIPCTYLVLQGGEDGLGWYLDATRVVVETCEWVLAQKDPDSYILHWSG